MADFNPNPEERQAEKRFEFDPLSQQRAQNLRQAEQSGSDSGNDFSYDNTADQARQAEQSGSDEDFGYQKSVQDTNARSNKTGWRGKLSGAVKKGGPVAAVAGMLIGGSMMMSAIMTPALAVNHFYELLTEKFNYQEFTNSIRIRKLGLGKWKSKVTTKYGFGLKKERFSSISESQMKQFKKAGFNIEADETKSLLGRKRYKIKSMELIDNPTNTKIKVSSPAELDAAYKNPVFRKHYKQGTRGSFGQFSDSIIDKVRQKIGLSKSSIDSTKSKTNPNDPDADDTKSRTKADLDDALDERVNGKMDDFDGQSQKFKQKIDEATSGGKATTNVDDVNAAKSLKDMADETNKTVKTKTKFKPGKALGAVANVVDKVGDLCGIAQMISTAIYAGKVVYGSSLARYAFTFLSMDDKIRSGDATEEEIAYFGNKLMATKTFQDGSGNVDYSNTAFDSFGYDYISNKYSTKETVDGGKTTSKPTLDANAKNYQIGAGNELINLYREVIEKLGNGTEICNIAVSPGGMAAQAAIGIVMFGLAVVSGGVSLLPMLIGGVSQLAMFGLRSYVQQKISAAMTGNVVGSQTEGEDMGNALASGSGYAMGQIARVGANMPMDKTAALAYLNEYQSYIAEVGEEIRATSSPFDISSRHTMMGSIVANFMPQIAKMHTFTGKINSLFQVARMSLIGLTPVSSAATLVNNQSYLEMCDDSSLPNAAFDPYCNPVLGLPVNNIDSQDYTPEAVIEWFESRPRETFRKWFKPVDASGNDCYIKNGDPNYDRTTYLYSSAAKNNECPDDYQWRINDLAKEDGWKWICDPNKVPLGGVCKDPETYDWMKKDPWKENESVTNAKSYAILGEKGGNDLYNHSLNCVYRPDDTPWGADGLVDTNSKSKFSWFDERSELGGATWREAYDNGQSCVITDGDKPEKRMQKIMFSLYFMDERLQCMIDGGNDCQIEKNSYYDITNPTGNSDGSNGLPGGTGTVLTSGTTEQKLAALFPNGVPTSESEMQPYLTEVEVTLADENGNDRKRKLKVHKALEEQVKTIMDKINKDRFPVKSIYCYDWRGMSTDASKQSHHSYGTACDINPDENPCYDARSGTFCYKGTYAPGVNKFSIPKDGAVVRAFEEAGWVWGGKWTNGVTDYMHFSYTGY
ncbi:MAG: M15 family metallopeptidase [Candidatus Saccharibacteria bacterium]|nr:M15 family metallopeptidase [Candidatus Saccharibacteria bacterium]